MKTIGIIALSGVIDKEKLNLEKKKAEEDHNYKMKSLSKKPAKTS